MHVVLFDIDGTLLNAGGAGQRAMEAALERLFGATRPVHGISTAGRTDRAIVADLFAFHGIDCSSDNLTRFLTEYLRRLPQELSALPGMVLPGVNELLAALAPRDDVLLSLLTGNFRRGAEIKLEHHGLRGHFVAGGFGDDHHDRDDVARMAVASLAEHLGHERANHQLWVIGDTPSDVKCGRAVGARVVAVATGMYSADELQATSPDHLFESFAATFDVLALFD